MNKKGQGMILSMIIGVAFLVTTVIIAFVVVSNVATVESDTASLINQLISNESISIGNTTATSNKVSAVNFTGFQSPVLVSILNGSSPFNSIEIANFTIDSTGLMTNTTAGGNRTTTTYLVSYTYDSKITTISSENLRKNFTRGVDNVSSKIPTVLLIAAVVLILGVLVLLWTQYKKMDVGSGGGL